MSDMSSRECAALEDALESGAAGLAAVAHEVGASAARVGSPLRELLEHLERAYARKEQREPPFAVVVEAAAAWDEAMTDYSIGMLCENPLTGLATLPHLRMAVEAVYRRAARDGTNAHDAHVIVIVELAAAGGGALAAPLAMLEAAESLRLVYGADETIAQIDARRIAALVGAADANHTILNLVAILLKRRLAQQPAPQVWTHKLPQSIDGVGPLLGEMTQ